MNYIFDTSSIILLFEKCNIRPQLREFSEANKLYVPSRVFVEFKEGRNLELVDIKEFEEVFFIVNPNLNGDLLPYFNFEDSSGEIWVLSFALENPEYCCVIDEEFGRNIAALFSMNLTGAIGIIEEMKNSGLLSDKILLHIKDRVRQSGFYLSQKIVKELNRICSSHQT